MGFTRVTALHFRDFVNTYPNCAQSGADYCRIPCSFQLKPQRSHLFMA